LEVDSNLVISTVVLVPLALLDVPKPNPNIACAVLVVIAVVNPAEKTNIASGLNPIPVVACEPVLAGAVISFKATLVKSLPPKAI